MHTAPMADSQGEFAEFKTQPDVPCRKCGVHAGSMREWESSCGGYMTDQGALTITDDVYAARRLRRQMSAGFRALDMKERHGGDWRPVEHGFEDSKTPNA